MSTHSDLLTQLQAALNSLCSMFFNFVGALQRDAPPVKVKEELLSDVSTYDLNKDTTFMATQLISGFKVVEELINALPNACGDNAVESKAFEALQSESHELSKQLQAEGKKAQELLHIVQELFGLLVEYKLNEKAIDSRQAPTVVVPPR